jgi:penicillin-insensitive murein endopeptidase
VALPPVAKPNDPKIPAKELFGRQAEPAKLEARTIGFYAKGCLAGAQALPVNGRTWQVMRLSRNRNWGHPELVQFLERLAEQAPQTGWRGLLVGDMSQPRGGPMLGGHASHQVGLDADIWLTPMPDRELTRVEREQMMATMIVREDRKDVDPKVWTPAHVNLIKAAAMPALTANGSTRCSHGMDTTGTSTSGWIVLPTTRTASRSRRGPPTRAAARSSITGSSRRT